MVDERPPCDHQVDVDDRTWFECELPMHHPGDHQVTYTWPNEPHGPKLPPPVTMMSRYVPPAWAEQILNQLFNAAAMGSPFVNADTVARQVIKRDLEG